MRDRAAGCRSCRRRRTPSRPGVKVSPPCPIPCPLTMSSRTVISSTARPGPTSTSRIPSAWLAPVVGPHRVGAGRARSSRRRCAGVTERLLHHRRPGAVASPSWPTSRSRAARGRRARRRCGGTRLISRAIRPCVAATCSISSYTKPPSPRRRNRSREHDPVEVVEVRRVALGEPAVVGGVVRRSRARTSTTKPANSPSTSTTSNAVGPLAQQARDGPRPSARSGVDGLRSLRASTASTSASVEGADAAALLLTRQAPRVTDWPHSRAGWTVIRRPGCRDRVATRGPCGWHAMSVC